MKAANTISDDPVREYQCPGEEYTISHAVHLGRLASYYWKCRQCPHHHDTGTLNKRQVDRLGQLQQSVAISLYREEDIAGIALNELSPARVRETAAAFGLLVRELAEADHATVVMAGDGRSISAEMTAAAAEGLRWAGTDVIDVATAVAPSLVAAIKRHHADGGLLIGNPLGRVHTTGMTFWGGSAMPLSSPGTLDRLREIIDGGINRPVRRFGSLRREDAERNYLATLRPYYHALRPLKFVLDTPSPLVARYLNELIEPVACELIPLADATAVQAGPGSTIALANGRSRRSGGAGGKRNTGQSRQRFSRNSDTPRRRLLALGGQVVERGAHFGLVIDGDGELLSCVDERGQPIAAERLLLVIASSELREPTRARVVLEEGADAATAETFRRLGYDLRFAPPSREAMGRALREAAAPWGAGPSGRIWLSENDAPSADAVGALTMLVAALSQSDRTLSEAVDEALARIIHEQSAARPQVAS